MYTIDRPKTTVDLARIRANAEAIARQTGRPLIGVVKADAYGLGAPSVVRVLDDLVEAFYVFDAAEVLNWVDRDILKPTIAMLGKSQDHNDYVRINVRPAVWNADRAKWLRKARPVLSLDTGQGRFGCAPDDAEAVLRAGECDEALTHATTVAQARLLRDTLSGRVAKMHAAGTALLGEPDAWLDAVRPGLALYHDAARVTAPLIEARDVRGPAGYGGFVSSTGRLGTIAAGYSNGMRAGAACLINGHRRAIPEVGMQSAFVELGPGDKAGDEVVLLGDGVTLAEVATAWGTSQHEALLRLAGLGARSYIG